MIITSAIAILSTILVYRSSSVANKRQHNRYDIELINKTLTEFYYPFLLLLKTNSEMFKAFSKNKFKDDPNFSTLVALLQEQKFTDNEKVLLNEIIENNKKILELIAVHGNQVDDYDLIQDLAQASGHFRIIILAYEQKIVGDEDIFNEYTYPTTIVSKTENVIKQKLLRLTKLRS